jgi:excisionase family DNA binding protein
VSAPLHPPPDRELLRVSEVARALGVSHRTVLSWLHTGKLQGGRLPGGNWRVPASVVERVRVELGITDDEGG